VVREVGWKTIFRLDDDDENIYWAIDLRRVRTRRIEDRYWVEVNWTKCLFKGGTCEHVSGSSEEPDNMEGWGRAESVIEELDWS
jgi:hypothetical protein